MRNDAKTPSALMTVAELAASWRQSEASVYRKVRSGQIPSVRLGDERAAIRIPRVELERLYDSTVGSDSSVDAPVEHRETSENASAS